MKKWLAVLLCIAVFTASTALMLPSAGAAEFCDCECVPVIQMTAGQGALTENYGTPEQKSYYGLDMLENMQRDFVPELANVRKALLTFSPSKILDALINMVDAWIGPLAMNADGTSVKDLDRYDFDREETMAKDHRTPYLGYTFPFDWRESPFETADKLNDFVQVIKAHTGHEHVYIESVSGSGSVLIAYLDKYVNGVENPDALGIVLGISTAYGTPMIGEFLNSHYTIHPKNLGMMDIIYVAEQVETSTSDSIITLMNVLYYTGVLDTLIFALSFFPEGGYDRIYEEIVRKTFGHWPGMWAWCPPEDYASARARLIEGHPEYEEYKYLDIIDRYHEFQSSLGDIMQEANKKIKVAVVTGYNMALVPVGRDYNNTSDTMVPVESASLGATAAPYGETLGKNYKQKIPSAAGRNYVSPDSMIDASTCALPDNTWFIKDLPHHLMYEYGGWFQWWKNAPKGQDTVFDSPDFPQYLRRLKKDQLDTDPVVPVTGDEEVSLADRLLGFWDTVLGVIRVVMEWITLPLRELMNEYVWSKLV